MRGSKAVRSQVANTQERRQVWRGEPNFPRKAFSGESTSQDNPSREQCGSITIHHTPQPQRAQTARLPICPTPGVQITCAHPSTVFQLSAGNHLASWIRCPSNLHRMLSETEGTSQAPATVSNIPIRDRHHVGPELSLPPGCHTFVSGLDNNMRTWKMCLPQSSLR